MRRMFFVSSRKNFWNTMRFSSTDDIRELDLDSGVAGPSITLADLSTELAGKNVLVLVHGYNNDRDDVLKAYGQLDLEYRRLGFLGAQGAPYDALVGYVWPAGAVAVSFFTARGRASDTAPRFSRFLAHVRTTTASIDLNTHSLGAHVALEALRGQPAGFVRHAWNFASAVDNESIEKGERYYGASQACERLYVFHSKRDPVLRTWYRVGDFPEFDSALGLDGPEDPHDVVAHSPHVRVVNCKSVVATHGGYRSSGEVYAFMKTELHAPATGQFFTLAKTPEAIMAVFATAGGTV